MDASDVDRREIYRYLGIRGESVDERTKKLVEGVLCEYAEAVRERSVVLSFGCTVEGDTVTLRDTRGAEAAVFASADLSRALRSCTGAVLMAATLGAECDRLMLRCEVNDLAAAAAAQACGAACIELLCDKICSQIALDARSHGLYCRRRFSPGYGDFDIGAQARIFELLQCPQKIGLALTPSLQMTPSKSVSAIIGLSPGEERCETRGCGGCKKKECGFRHE